ncbi:unnamed protein product [Parnassius apollo]|uniref:(apollo) hypothetical protein n=1 Tax=Parnassius apollo TaxID=110799 RepID=A0A8S3W0Y9_PARAO|nr:unnamed protein product [Parnassius apollo]
MWMLVTIRRRHNETDMAIRLAHGPELTRKQRVSRFAFAHEHVKLGYGTVEPKRGLTGKDKNGTFAKKKTGLRMVSN